MIKKLLIATDLSPRSDRAMDRALSLMNEWEAPLVVLHVLDEELPSRTAEALEQEVKSLIDEQLHSIAGERRALATRKIASGAAFEEILKEALNSDADLIIMGMHRADILGDFFLGTTVERVIRYGNHSVLVVRDWVRGPYQRVVVGFDFSVHARRAVEWAARLVPHAEIYLVHAFDVPFGGFVSGTSDYEEVKARQTEQMDAMLAEELHMLVRSLPAPPARLEPVLVQGTVREAILGQVTTLRPDLLVVGTHGRTGVAHSLLGSVAEDLLSHPPCDVLAVKAW